MREQLKSLANETFDLLVVGAGIHGVSAAWTASRLGLKTALIDRDDFGSGASANSLKVMHGGLRYLQHGNVSRMRESIRARRRFLALAPHLVRPQPFAIPTSGSGMRSNAALRVALALNDLVSWDRNRGMPQEQHLPAGRVLSASEAGAIWPMLPREAYDGGAVWYDGLCHNTERMTLFFVRAANDAGAVVANYVAAERLIVEGGAVAGVEVRDVLTGGQFSIKARSVINAAGPWWRQWKGVDTERSPLVGAWDVIVDAQWFGRYGVGLESRQSHDDAEALVKRGHRNLFFVPWRGGTMIGTVYEPYEGDPEAYRPSRTAVELFVAEINGVLPDAKLSVDQITMMHVGVQPASPSGGSPEPDKHSAVVEEGARGLFSVKGVKFTTGLMVGEAAARVVAGGSKLPTDPVPTRADTRAEARVRGLNLSDELCARLTGLYGPLVGEVLDEAWADGAASLEGAPLYLCAEIRHAVKKEQALRLTDVILRRTDLGTFRAPSRQVVRAVGDEMGRLLGWSPERREAEVAHLSETYQRLIPPGA